MIKPTLWLMEKNLLPDPLLRAGIRKLLKSRLKELQPPTSLTLDQLEKNWASDLRNSPLAIETQAANEQHYEVPSEFYTHCLGNNRKYSSALYQEDDETLEQAEENMLELYCERAGLSDGQDILDLGCGWGSLSLYLAKKYPGSKITGFSNSHSQRAYITEQAKSRKLNNLTILTGNILHQHFEKRFDRILSIEMFEHMRNYEMLLSRISNWLNPNGKLFIHIFCHKNRSYPFEVRDESDWMSRYFFTGGQMPSSKLMESFQKDLKIEKQWIVDGTHYQKTAEHWLANTDRNKDKILTLFTKHYGKEQALKWFVYWRVFFMSCAELFGFNKGQEWMVQHILWKPAPQLA